MSAVTVSLTAVQRNVDAHQNHAKYRDVFHGQGETSLGISTREYAALQMLKSAAEGFQNEFWNEINSRSRRHAHLREARRILWEAHDKLDREIGSKLQMYFSRRAENAA